MRLLDREAEIETRYGGGFVQSIEGVAGATEGDRRFDWFFYMNGIESPVGSADVQVSGWRPGVVGPPRVDRRDARTCGHRLLARAVSPALGG